MSGTLTVQNTPFFHQVANQVAAFHGATLEPESSFSGFPRLFPCPSVPADFPI